MILRNDSNMGSIDYDAWRILQEWRELPWEGTKVTLHDTSNRHDDSETPGVCETHPEVQPVVVDTEDTIFWEDEEQVPIDDGRSPLDMVLREEEEEEDNTDSVLTSIPLMEVTYK